MKMRKFDFSKYCTPAQLYLVLGVIGIICGFFANYSIETLLTKALFLVIWAWVLNWLCSKGFKAISWILVLLPFILVLFTYFFIKEVAVKEGALFDLSNIIKPPPGANGGGIQQLTPAQKDAAAKAKADADAKAKADAEKAAADKAAAEKAAADKAAADKVAACGVCGAMTSVKKKNECNQKNKC